MEKRDIICCYYFRDFYMKKCDVIICCCKNCFNRETYKVFFIFLYRKSCKEFTWKCITNFRADPNKFVNVRCKWLWKNKTMY